MNEHRLHINDIDIAYFDQHSEKKSTILFIHGNSLSKNTFQKQLNSKELENHRLISLDLPGHGNSGKGTTYHVPCFAELIADFIKELNLKNVILVGHSLGGHIAIEVTGRFPLAIVGMAIIGCPPLGIPADLENAFLPNPAERLLFQQDLSLEENKELAESIGNITSAPKIAADLQIADPCVRSSIGQSIVTTNYADEIEIINSLKIPYTIILGEEDPFCNPDYFKLHPFKTQWKNQIQVIPSGTHTPSIDNFLAFNELLYSFILNID
jgi:pimeloyl-ACP methyl ester carboxylesterase